MRGLFALIEEKYVSIVLIVYGRSNYLPTSFAL